MSDDEIVRTVTDEDYEDLISENRRVILDLWSTWCGPCIQMDPVVESLAEKYDKEIKFGKVNVEENKDIPSEFDVQSLPSILIFRDGEIVKKISGQLNKEEFECVLENNFDLE